MWWINFPDSLHLEIGLFLSNWPGGDGDSPEVEIVPDGVLKVVVHSTLGESGVQVLAKITGDGTWKYKKYKTEENKKILNFSWKVCLNPQSHHLWEDILTS